jgi:hypothetical protein
MPCGRAGALNGHTYALAGRTSEALRILKQLHEESSRKYGSPYDVAIVNLGLGDREAAIEWLIRACDEHAGWLIYLTVDLGLDPVRSDLRFRELLRRVGFYA